MVGFTRSVLAFLACAGLALADVNTVLSRISDLSNDLQTLDRDVKVVPSGVIGVGPALQVGVDAVTVDDAIVAATNAVAQSQPFSSSDSQRIVSALRTLATQGNTTLADTANNYAAFGGLQPVVLASIYQLKLDTDFFGIAFYGKLDQASLQSGVQILSGLNAAYDAVITAYGGTPS